LDIDHNEVTHLAIPDSMELLFSKNEKLYFSTQKFDPKNPDQKTEYYVSDKDGENYRKLTACKGNVYLINGQVILKKYLSKENGDDNLIEYHYALVTLNDNFVEEGVLLDDLCEEVKDRDSMSELQMIDFNQSSIIYIESNQVESHKKNITIKCVDRFTQKTIELYAKEGVFFNAEKFDGSYLMSNDKKKIFVNYRVSGQENNENESFMDVIYLK
jgi:hypothetical protein